jgi:F-type H+-transporting ATPase subunit delta
MSKKIIVNNLIATKYATAIFKLAEKNNKQNLIFSELQSLESLVITNEKLRAIIKNSYLSDKVKTKSLNLISENIKLSQENLNFLQVLAQKKRLNHIENIIKKYKLIWQEKNNEQNAKIISATKLSNKDIDNIKEILTNKFAKNFICTNIIEEEILGGVKIIIGSKMIDCSLINKLKLFEINSHKKLLA